MLHDTAASTLSLVGQGQVVDRETLAARARFDLEAMIRFSGDGAGLSDLRVMLLAVIDVVEPSVSHRVDQAMWLPTPVVEAFAGAATEAFNNIGRHSGVDRACLEVREAPSRVLVRISDRGRGFDTSALSLGRGLSRSIHGRMAGINGRVFRRSRSSCCRHCLASRCPVTFFLVDRQYCCGYRSDQDADESEDRCFHVRLLSRAARPGVHHHARVDQGS
jgi:hypothetical protein